MFHILETEEIMLIELNLPFKGNAFGKPTLYDYSD